MISLQITDVRDFMAKLLKTDLFDHFLMPEAVITTAVTYRIDGHLNTSFYSTDELEILGLAGLSTAPFSLFRSTCFDLIKGKRTPSFFKFVFMLSPENLKNTLLCTGSSFSENDISGVYLNLHFKDQMLTCTTGVSCRIFSTDRSFETEWDELVCRFLKNHGISYEILS